MRVVVGKALASRRGFLRDEAIRHLDARSDEDEVDFLALLRGDAAEVVEGVVHSRPFAGNLHGVFQYEGVGGEGAVGFRLVVYVEVARQYGWAVAYYFLYLPDDEQGTFTPGGDAYMVEMGIDGHEHLAALLVFHLCPRGDARAGSVPSDEPYAIGVLREPERVARQYFEAAFLVKYGRPTPIDL